MSGVGYPEDPDETIEDVRMREQRRFYSGDNCSALQLAYPSAYDQYSVPNHLDSNDRESSSHTYRTTHDSAQISFSSSHQQQETSYSNRQDSSSLVQDRHQGHPVSTSQPGVTSDAPAGSPNPKQHSPDPKSTRQGHERDRMDGSHNSHGASEDRGADESFGNQPVMEAAMRNLHKMFSRSDQHAGENDRSGQEELIHSEEPSLAQAQPDADVDEEMETEDVNADTEEPVVEYDQQPSNDDIAMLEDQHRPSTPVDLNPANPPTPVFSPLVPLKSVEPLEADLASTSNRAPRTLSVEASPQPQGLHLEGIEGLSFDLSSRLQNSY